MNKQDENFIIARTDLAYDDYESYQSQNLSDFTKEEKTFYDIPVIKNIVGEASSEVVGKKTGTYYTLDLSCCNINDTSTLEKIEKALAMVLKELLNSHSLLDKKAFVIGLGNASVTPDAIGPITVDNTIVTRHLALMNVLNEGFGNVCAMSPGVMGTTGIETYDIVDKISENLDVDYLIVVDALATSSIERINCTIQITDTGIKPGSGVGNKRKELSYETIHKPVIAIGVPTVVDAATITINTINIILDHLNSQMDEKYHHQTETEFLGSFGKLSETEKIALTKEVLTPKGLNLMVTKKEIDQDVDDLSKVIANGINLALHPGLFTGNTE